MGVRNAYFLKYLGIPFSCKDFILDISNSVSSQSQIFDSTDLKSVVRNRLDLSRFRLEIDLSLMVVELTQLYNVHTGCGVHLVKYIFSTNNSTMSVKIKTTHPVGSESVKNEKSNPI